MSGAALSLEERYKFQLRKHQMMVDWYVERTVVDKKIENPQAALNYCYHLEPRFLNNTLFAEQFIPTHQKRWKRELMIQERQKKKAIDEKKTVEAKETSQSEQTTCTSSSTQ